MEKYQKGMLEYYLKVLSTLSDDPIKRVDISERIKNIIRLFILEQFYREINDKETRDKVVKYLTDLFNTIKLKNKKKIIIIVCNELNNTHDVIDRNDLVVDISIDLGEFLYNFNVKLSDLQYDRTNSEDTNFVEFKEQISNV